MPLDREAVQVDDTAIKEELLFGLYVSSPANQICIITVPRTLAQESKRFKLSCCDDP